MSGSLIVTGGTVEDQQDPESDLPPLDDAKAQAAVVPSGGVAVHRRRSDRDSTGLGDCGGGGAGGARHMRVA